jgi:large subunit ribosomal protein L7/L12
MSDEKKVVEVPEKFKALVESIEKLSVLDLSELVKVLEEKFGVSASAPVMMAAAPGAAAAAEEKTSFNVELTEAGANKIGVIKVVREVTGLGLKEAKDMVDGAPKVIKEGADKATAEDIKKKIEEAGGKATLK